MDITPRTIVDAFSQQVGKTPKQIAIVFDGQTLSYQELDEKSNELAHYLIANGVQRGVLVAICIERSLEMVIGILGILKAGGAYVPIDPTYPEDRIAFMLHDSAAAVWITSSSIPSPFDANVQRIVLDEIGDSLQGYSQQLPDVRLHENDLAYTIYTSGSTGKPKGVQIEHRSLLNFLDSMRHEPGLTDRDILLALTTISFDIAGLELFLPLTSGAKIILASDASRIDGHRILDMVCSEKVTVLQATPATWGMLLDAGWKSKLPIKALCGGEALPLGLAKKLAGLCNEVWNMYGPTETTVWSTVKKIVGEEPTITIGHPIKNTQVYILDEHLMPLGSGEAGELFIGGAGIARGYLNRPELNDEKFLDDPFCGMPGSRMYRTGDLGRFLPNGEIQCLGRIDNQVKIQGFRIELGEIENRIGLFPTIKQNCVHVWEEKYGGKRLVAYLVGKTGQTAAVHALRDFLKKELPDYMVPTAFVQLEALPLSVNGKVDRKALPKPMRKRPQTGVLYRAPKTPIETYLIDSWKTLLEMDEIGVDDNFFELGGNSLLATKTVALLKEAYGFTLSVIKLYQHATASKIAREFEKKDNLGLPAYSKKNKKRAAIAIIGMAVRFPGADSISALWDLLYEGKEATRFFKQEELDSDIPDEEKHHPDYVRARGIINHVEEFDAALFGMSPVMAKLMDPQHRVFLEICRDVLESTGHLPSRYDGLIGVYAGCGNNTYYTNNLLSNKEEIAKFGAFQTTTLNEKDYLTTRVAYQLDLKGPAVGVYSACSTSLLAVAQAVEAIRSGQCDAALAGGIAVTVPVNSGHIYEEGAMLSNDGHCRPFDAMGKGTVFSDGAGVVLLKDLESAIRDGDTIFSVIKGVGVNNDGAGKGSFTAPNPEGQAKAIAMALADADFDPATISYVEAHGTATPLGDPIEIEGLKLAFGHQAKGQYCRIGSIKSNIGHLTHAAGVAGLVKTVLAMHHKLIPASINYQSPNPNIDFANSPFVVNDQLTDWESAGKRRAGVSSFGVGGTNVHVVLEEYEQETEMAEDQGEITLINWSARSEAALDAYADKLKNYILSKPQVTPGEIGRTLQATRQDFSWRASLTATDTADLLAKLEAKDWQKVEYTHQNSDIAFMFPGQGAQYTGMGQQLYQRESVYRFAIDECAAILSNELGEDIRKTLFADKDDARAAESLRNTYYTQPALFVTEYALARLWMSRGIMPSAFIGHSVGEFVAAHLAGVFSLADALKLIAARARLISQLPAGSMLSIRSAAVSILPGLPQGLSLAAINAPNLCVVAGEKESIAQYAAQLASQGVVSKPLHTSHAFHSEMMAPMLPDFRAVATSVKLNIPQIPIVSTVTGTWMKDSEAIDPGYWVDHVRATVRFSEAVQFLYQELQPVLLETGPGNVTSSLAKQQQVIPFVKVIDGISNVPDKALGECHSFYAAWGKLWQNGTVGSASRHKAKKRVVLPDLPTYAYDRKRYWVSPKKLDKGEHQNRAVHLAQGPNPIRPETNDHEMRKELLITEIKQLLEGLSGIALDGISTNASFIEIGFDSLLLTQIAQHLKKKFNLPITFRKLNEEYHTLAMLADYVEQHLPETVPSPPLSHVAPILAATGAPGYPNDALALISHQIWLLSQQVALLQGLQPAAPLSFSGIPHPNIQVGPDVGEAHEPKPAAGAVARSEAPIDAHGQHDFSEKIFPKTKDSRPPVPNARMGKDKDGNPAWFVEDETTPGKYLQVVLSSQ